MTSRPRVLPVLLLGVLAWLVPLGIGLVVGLLAETMDGAFLPEDPRVATLIAYLGMEVLFLGLLAWLARRSRQPLAQTFDAGPSALSLWCVPLVFLGHAIALGVGGLVAAWISPEPSEGMAMHTEFVALGLGHSIAPYFLVMAILPAITEEALYRGYIQSRLRPRLGPWVAILVSSLFFAVVHGDPNYIVAVLPSGIWLGYVAWISGSIRLGVVVHALWNGLLVVLMRMDGAEGEMEPEAASGDLLTLVVQLGLLLVLGRFLAYRARKNRPPIIPLETVPQRPL